MKTKSIIFALAFAATSFASFTSCSPQSIDDINQEQNINKETVTKIPSNG